MLNQWTYFNKYKTLKNSCIDHLWRITYKHLLTLCFIITFPGTIFPSLAFVKCLHYSNEVLFYKYNLKWNRFNFLKGSIYKHMVNASVIHFPCGSI